MISHQKSPIATNYSLKCSLVHIANINILPFRLAPFLIQSFAWIILSSALELRIMICCMSRHVKFLLNEKVYIIPLEVVNGI